MSKGEMMQFTGTVKAINKNGTSCLIEVDGMTGWVPDSEADYFSEPEIDKEITFEIPEWLANKKNFIET